MLLGRHRRNLRKRKKSCRASKMCWAGNGSASQGSGTRTTAGVSTRKELGTSMRGSHGKCGSTRGA